MEGKTHVVLFSGGHANSICAVEVYKRFGNERLILLNHDISEKVEDRDIKRFKQDVAAYCGVPITYANAEGLDELTPLAVARKVGAFGFGEQNKMLCTKYLKTDPFKICLQKNFPRKKGCVRGDVNFYYGFAMNEEKRMSRSKRIMESMGYHVDFPLTWNDRITNIEEVGIRLPDSYADFKHANCIGCLKAGRVSWYATYVKRPDIFKEACDTENLIGHSIMKDGYLTEFIPLFERMKQAGVLATDKICPNAFWNLARFVAAGQQTLY